MISTYQNIVQQQKSIMELHLLTLYNYLLTLHTVPNAITSMQGIQLGEKGIVIDINDLKCPISQNHSSIVHP